MTTTLNPTESAPATNRQRRSGWRWVAVGVLAAALLLVWRSPSWWAPVTTEDIGQSRLDTAPAAPSPGHPLLQTFVARHNGLVSITVTLARVDNGEAQGGTLALALSDEAGRQVARTQWPNAQLRHNQLLELSLPPQRGSEGRSYTLTLEGSEGNSFSAWAYSLDVLDGGALTGAEGAAELQFHSRYRLLLVDALRSVALLAWESLPVLGMAALLLLLPGSVLLVIAAPRLPRLDPAVWLALALALGTAVWPLLWRWLTLGGGHWAQGPLFAFLLLLAATLAALLRWRPPRLAPVRGHHLLLALVLLAGLAVRLLAVRDLAFPPWVDASRHALITQVMAGSGQWPGAYEPYLVVEDVPYHFGFHSIAAALAVLGKGPLPRLLLLLGQGLGAAVPLALYGAAWMATRRREAALLAAFLVAFPFYFPGYYASWGRFTQLTSLLILPLGAVLTWQLLRGARGWRAAWPLLGLLAAGLALVHFRVFLLYVPFVLLAALTSRLRSWRPMLAAAALGAFLGAPYLLPLARRAGPSGILSTPPSEYVAFPTGYLTAGWEQAFWGLAALAWLVAIIAAMRRRPWARLPLLLAAWLGIVVLALAGPFSAMWLMTLNSAYIVFFMPLALLLAIGAGRLLRALRGAPSIRPYALAMSAFFLTLAFLFGARQQVTIINPETILARPTDLAALDWVDDALPEDARIAVNAWRWLGITWAGSDGGAWLLPLTGRASSTPPVDYIHSTGLVQDVDAFNRSAQAISDWSEASAAGWLRDQGITHLFVGARGGFFDPAALSRNPALCQLYAGDGAFVFGWRDDPAGGCTP